MTVEKNHTGSSKSMEPAVAVELFNNATKSHVKFSTYTGDDDSTTESHIRQNVPYGVEKWSDTVHIKRSLTTRLYNFGKRNKFSDCSVLSQNVINYLAKCFSYCLAQNKGNPQGLKLSIQCIVPCAFGHHEHCDRSWCGYRKDCANYKHKDLPYGKDLHGSELERALQNLFSEYRTDTVIKKLFPAANSQRNESLNSVVGSKTPKIRYYGGSESNDFRVSCSVAQTNLGHQYVGNTLQGLGIEPGSFCIMHTEKIDKKVAQDKTRKSSVDFKRRRLQLQKGKISETLRKEASEGKTYETGIGLNLNAGEVNRQSTATSAIDVSAANVSANDLQEFEKVVSNYTDRPPKNYEKYDKSKLYNFVLFDLETNTTGKAAEICQLSATDTSGLQFSIYVLPTSGIDQYASRVNKNCVKKTNLWKL